MKVSHAAVKSFDRRGVSCKNARTVQFSVLLFSLYFVRDRRPRGLAAFSRRRRRRDRLQRVFAHASSAAFCVVGRLRSTTGQTNRRPGLHASSPSDTFSCSSQASLVLRLSDVVYEERWLKVVGWETRDRLVSVARGRNGSITTPNGPMSSRLNWIHRNARPQSSGR